MGVAVRISDLAFKEGFGTSLSVVDSQTSLLAVKLQRLHAIYMTDVCLTELLSTKGDADEILEYIIKSDKEKLWLKIY